MTELDPSLTPPSEELADPITNLNDTKSRQTPFGFRFNETTVYLDGDGDDVVVIDGVVQHPLSAAYKNEDILANVKHIRDWFPRRTTPPDETQS